MWPTMSMEGGREKQKTKEKRALIMLEITKRPFQDPRDLLSMKIGVTPRPGGPIRGNRRDALSRSQFLETYSRPRKAY